MFRDPVGEADSAGAFVYVAVAEYVPAGHVDASKVSTYLHHKVAELKGGADVPAGVESSPQPIGAIHRLAGKSVGFQFAGKAARQRGAGKEPVKKLSALSPSSSNNIL